MGTEWGSTNDQNIVGIHWLIMFNILKKKLGLRTQMLMEPGNMLK
jgi:hypothetical protein